VQLFPSDALLGGLNVNRLLIPTTLSRSPLTRQWGFFNVWKLPILKALQVI